MAISDMHHPVINGEDGFSLELRVSPMPSRDPHSRTFHTHERLERTASTLPNWSHLGRGAWVPPDVERIDSVT